MANSDLPGGIAPPAIPIGGVTDSPGKPVTASQLAGLAKIDFGSRFRGHGIAPGERIDVLGARVPPGKSLSESDLVGLGETDPSTEGAGDGFEIRLGETETETQP